MFHAAGNSITTPSEGSRLGMEMKDSARVEDNIPSGRPRTSQGIVVDKIVTRERSTRGVKRPSFFKLGIPMTPVLTESGKSKEKR